MGSILTVADPQHKVEKKDFWLSVGHYCLQGEQDLLEDEVAVDLNCGPAGPLFNSNVDGKPIQDKCSFVGLFDGHDGNHCSVFFADKMREQFLLSSHYPTNMEKALFQAFVMTDYNYLESVRSRKLEDSSTGFVLVVWENSVYAAATGDTIGFSFSKSQGKMLPMVDPEVTKGRVLGSLFNKDTTQLIPDPVVEKVEVTADLLFIVIGTWTFWQQVTPEEVSEYVLEQLETSKSSNTVRDDNFLSNLCLELVTKAGKKEPNENMSCLILLFDTKTSSGLFEVEV